MKKRLLIFVLGFSFLCSFAQDNPLSFMQSTPLSINPANTGRFNTGDWRLHGNHHNRFSQIVGKPFVYNSLSFDMGVGEEEKAGVGFLLSNNKTAGSGAMKDFSLAFAYSYKVSFDILKKHNLRFGLQAGVIQKSFESNNLTFDNQYVPGYGFDPGLSTGESMKNEQLLNADFNFGMLYYMDDEFGMFNPWAGVSGYHLSQPNESFFDNSISELPIKLVGTAGCDIKITDKIGLIPNVIFSMQGDYNQIDAGSFVRYNASENTAAKLGVAYRTGDALAIGVGFDLNNYSFMFSYDMNMSSMNKISSNGGFQLSIRYIHKKKKKEPAALLEGSNELPTKEYTDESEPVLPGKTEKSEKQNLQTDSVQAPSNIEPKTQKDEAKGTYSGQKSEVKDNENKQPQKSIYDNDNSTNKTQENNSQPVDLQQNLEINQPVQTKKSNQQENSTDTEHKYPTERKVEQQNYNDVELYYVPYGEDPNEIKQEPKQKTQQIQSQPKETSPKKTQQKQPVSNPKPRETKKEEPKSIDDKILKPKNFETEIDTNKAIEYMQKVLEKKLENQ